jgi:DNA (cytosine-5)-methyltransferase 1
MKAAGDITKIKTRDVPAHDILCAGFPCQPFSKAGAQAGLDDPKWGGLFHHILRIVKHHKPRYIILENVPNFSRHDEGRTWLTAKQLLRRAGYDVDSHEFSPHHFGIPQIRDRIYIVAERKALNSFSWPTVDPAASGSVSIRAILEDNPAHARSIPLQVRQCLDVWQDFLNRFPKDQQLPSFPIWSMEFGATYPYEDTTPFASRIRDLVKRRGSHGVPLKGHLRRKPILELLPSHARTQSRRFPEWKIQFIRANRELYERNKEWIDDWKSKIVEFPSSFQKFEWNCQGSERDLSKLIIQVRASGVRVKRPTTAPSLVAMTATQVPIIGWESRYMTPSECKKLQSMEALEHLPASPTRAYQALGNAINVRVAEQVVGALVGGDNRIPASPTPLSSVAAPVAPPPAHRGNGYG